MWIKASVTIFASVLLGSIPLIAVVSHKRNPPPAETLREQGKSVPSSDNLILYTPEGDRVAYCKWKDGDLDACREEPGKDLTDVMRSWLQVYFDLKEKEKQ